MEPRSPGVKKLHGPGAEKLDCKLVTLQATCLTLMALSIDRFCAIVLPFKSIDFRRPRVAIIVSVCIWIGSFLLSIPVALRQTIYTVGGQVLCRELWPSAAAQQSYMVYMVSITYIIPLTTSIFCGAMIVRQKIRAFSGISYMGISFIPLTTSIFCGAMIVRQRRIEQNNTICSNFNSSSSMVSITYIILLTTSIFCGAMIVRQVSQLSLTTLYQRRIKLCRKFAFSGMSYMVYMASITYIILAGNQHLLWGHDRATDASNSHFLACPTWCTWVSISYIIPLTTSIFCGAMIVRQRRIEQNNKICRNFNSSSSMVSITYIIPLTTSIFCGAMIVRQVSKIGS
ncbi:receptor [Branchiostoma belcheri]|nr:receptor [Branchiostoma belcheri]